MQDTWHTLGVVFGVAGLIIFLHWLLKLWAFSYTYRQVVYPKVRPSFFTGMALTAVAGVFLALEGLSRAGISASVIQGHAAQLLICLLFLGYALESWLTMTQEAHWQSVKDRLLTDRNVCPRTCQRAMARTELPDDDLVQVSLALATVPSTGNHGTAAPRGRAGHGNGG